MKAKIYKAFGANKWMVMRPVADGRQYQMWSKWDEAVRSLYVSSPKWLHASAPDYADAFDGFSGR